MERSLCPCEEMGHCPRADSDGKRRSDKFNMSRSGVAGEWDRSDGEDRRWEHNDAREKGQLRKGRMEKQ